MNHIRQPVQGRRKEDCERHWRELYYFIFKGKRCIYDAIEAYYKSSPSVQGWEKAETESLFFDPDFAQKSKRSEEDWTIHYYDVLGRNFGRWNASIIDGISAVVQVYYETQDSKLEMKKVKQE